MDQNKSNIAHNVALKAGKKELEDKKWWA